MSEHLLDPCTVLEVPADADPAMIRRAYRRLAMRWHPDRNPDPQAGERFRQIRAAYERLTSVAADHDDDDEPPVTGADRHEELWLRIEEAMLGCDKPFTIRRRAACADCDGAGTVTLKHTRLCAACHGSGRVRVDARLQPCRDCEGRGFVTRGACEACSGQGRLEADQQVTVHVAAGVLPGEVLRLKGLGELAPGDGLPGTLYLTVRLLPDALFRLDGRDITLRQPISVLRLLAGGRISVAGPLGPVVADFGPEEVRDGRLRLAGRGFPGRDGAAAEAGDLVVELQPVLPSSLEPAQREVLAELDAALEREAARHFPELRAWWQRYRGR